MLARWLPCMAALHPHGRHRPALPPGSLGLILPPPHLSRSRCTDLMLREKWLSRHQQVLSRGLEEDHELVSLARHALLCSGPAEGQNLQSARLNSPLHGGPMGWMAACPPLPHPLLVATRGPLCPDCQAQAPGRVSPATWLQDGSNPCTKDGCRPQSGTYHNHDP